MRTDPEEGGHVDELEKEAAAAAVDERPRKRQRKACEDDDEMVTVRQAVENLVRNVESQGTPGSSWYATGIGKFGHAAKQPARPAGSRKSYVVRNPRRAWSADEHKRFLEGLKLFGRDWKQLTQHVGSRTVSQVRSHMQKFAKHVGAGLIPGTTIADLPAPRPRQEHAQIAQARKEVSACVRDIVKCVKAREEARLRLEIMKAVQQHKREETTAKVMVQQATARATARAQPQLVEAAAPSRQNEPARAAPPRCRQRPREQRSPGKQRQPQRCVVRGRNLGKDSRTRRSRRDTAALWPIYAEIYRQLAVVDATEESLQGNFTDKELRVVMGQNNMMIISFNENTKKYVEKTKQDKIHELIPMINRKLLVLPEAINETKRQNETKVVVREVVNKLIHTLEKQERARLGQTRTRSEKQERARIGQTRTRSKWHNIRRDVARVINGLVQKTIDDDVLTRHLQVAGETERQRTTGRMPDGSRPTNDDDSKGKTSRDGAGKAAAEQQSPATQLQNTGGAADASIRQIIARMKGGERVQVKYPGAGWFVGTVQCCDRNSGLASVMFDDDGITQQMRFGAPKSARQSGVLTHGPDWRWSNRPEAAKASTPPEPLHVAAAPAGSQAAWKRPRSTSTKWQSNGLSCCRICAESFAAMTPQRQVYILDCGHPFCGECIQEWFGRASERSCPLCRRCYAMNHLRRCKKAVVADMSGTGKLSAI